MANSNYTEKQGGAPAKPKSAPNVTREWLYEKYVIEGLPSKAIAELLGTGHRTAVSLLHRHNIPVRPKTVKTKGLHTYQHRDWLGHYYLGENLNVIEIGKLAGVDARTITRWLHKHNIPIKRDVQGRTTYKDKAWLEELYGNQQLSTAQIAQIAGVDPAVIVRWLHRHGIPVRSARDSLLTRFGRLKADPDATYRNREWLEHKYIKERLTTVQIGELVGVGSDTVGYWLAKFGIERRPAGSPSNHVNLTAEAIDFINGTLLGDAAVSAKTNTSACIQLASKFYEYATWFRQQLAKWGIEQTGKIAVRQGGYGGLGYKYTSKHYVELKQFRDRWYPYGKKIVPKDLVLKPVTVRQWFIDDGSVSLRSGGRRPTAVFHTNGFLPKDVEWLVEELNELGIPCHRRPSNNTIGTTVEGALRLLEYIGPCPKATEHLYGYKWGRVLQRGYYHQQLPLSGML